MSFSLIKYVFFHHANTLSMISKQTSNELPKEEVHEILYHPREHRHPTPLECTTCITN